MTNKQASARVPYPAGVKADVGGIVVANMAYDYDG